MQNRKLFRSIPLTLATLLLFAGCSQSHAPQQSSAPVQAQATASPAPADASAPADSSAPTDASAPADVSTPADSSAPADVSTPADASTPAAFSQAVTLEEAKAIALDHAGVSADQADFVKVSEEREHGRTVFELEFQDGSKLYEYEIAGADGGILSSKWEAMPRVSGEGGLTLEEAKTLVLEWVPGATEWDFREFKSDYDDGRLVYEGELVYNGVEYEFEIDASTGARLSWEEEAAYRH